MCLDSSREASCRLTIVIDNLTSLILSHSCRYYLFLIFLKIVLVILDVLVNKFTSSRCSPGSEALGFSKEKVLLRSFFTHNIFNGEQDGATVLLTFMASFILDGQLLPNIEFTVPINQLI